MKIFFVYFISTDLTLRVLCIFRDSVCALGLFRNSLKNNILYIEYFPLFGVANSTSLSILRHLSFFKKILDS